jgi:hypothetical protein
MLTALLDGPRADRERARGHRGRDAADRRARTSARLVEGCLLAMEAQGRHRYFRLADDEVAHALEALLGVAFRRPADAPRHRPARAGACARRASATTISPASSRSRSGAAAGERRAGERPRGLGLSESGTARFRALGVDVDAAARQRRVFCRPCLDWGERRDHLAGALGAALLQRLYELRWAAR